MNTGTYKICRLRNHQNKSIHLVAEHKIKRVHVSKHQSPKQFLDFLAKQHLVGGLFMIAIMFTTALIINHYVIY